MSRDFQSRTGRQLLLVIAAALLVGVNLFVVASPASADPATPREILKSMSDYVAGQQSLSARFDVSMEIITPEIETLQFVASGELQISRPNSLHVRRTGGYNEVQLFSNGERATIVDTDRHSYANLASPGTVDQLIDRLQQEYGIAMPGADLLLTSSYDELTRDVLTARHIGLGVVNGVECEHLAFRNGEVDWQIWIRTGDRPLPCRYVITSKTVAGGPQYTVTFTDWAVNSAASPTAFVYRPPSGSTEVPLRDLTHIGELPQPAPFSQGKE